MTKVGGDFTASGEFTQYSADLSAFAGQTVYVAIRHYNIYDMFRLNIDDIMIGTPVDPVEEAEWIYVYGLENPDSTILGLTPETTYEVQVLAYNENGESAWTDSFIFTTGKKTSIEEIVTDAKGDNIYYNIMGQKMDPANLPAGIYIHNGKKILVK